MRPFLAAFALLCLILTGAVAHAGCTTAVAVTTASTAVLAANDLGNQPRHTLSLTNAGPDVVFCAFGTSNVATAANGFPLFIGETLNFPPVSSPANAVTNPPSADVACISFNGGGNTTASVIACDQ
jgi:hypothetical protein